MALKDQITEDMKTAMRAKDSERLGTIRLLLAACKQKEVDERVVLDDVQIIAIIDKMIKQRKDSIDAFTKADRKDMADKEAQEITVLTGYLPARLGADDVLAAVKAIVADMTQATGSRPAPGDIGKVMALAKAKLAGQAEMGQISAAVKLALAS